MKPLVECVPNFSEGRDPAKIQAILAAIREVPHVFVLAHESDADHNRSVITLAGEPEAVAEAAVRAVGKAAEIIDLTRQTGAHPRIGATDVVPFIPVHGVTLDDCVALAKKAAGEIWRRYRVPVYLYEAAAQRPERANLEKIRKGQFEGLREEVLTNPDRAPDIGEPCLHPTAGATVVGARKFLIAYNINLDTPDVEIAKKIAKTIRFSSGGMPFVKAMGVDLRARNLAQVSMNLTDFEQTPVHVVFEAVKREAARYGAGIVGSEIVGLIPRRAIEMTADAYLKVENFSPAQVFENRLEEALLAAQSKSSAGFAALAQPFLDAVAQPSPTPGGGSVAALAGALGASLGQMVAGLSRKKKSLAAHAASFEAAIPQFQAAARELTEAIDRDASSYESVLVAHRLPRETVEEQQQRDRAIQRAFEAAVEAPLQIARRAVEVFEKLGQLEAMSAPSMVSDVRVGRMMAATAVRGALENVRINLESVTDAAFAAKARSEAGILAARIAESPVAAGKI
ncbi:MAG TPA: glutamate formimidoyltransferase [Candidatus Acidoferrales bacterium]|jgi:glutamate formiminotransferase|nr:glutamate formimidoyltransferase [Candidatus Acidoferrales bacterium]